MNPFWLCLMFLAFQDAEPAPPPPPKVEDPERVFAQGRRAFILGEHADAINLLAPLVAESHGQAMLLSADAYYAVGTPRAMRRAINLYERCLYEDDSIPFPDHSYHQLSQIYMEESRRAEAEGSIYEAREMAAEAEFYMRRLLKKFPDSYYRDTTLNQILNLAEERGEHDKAVEYARIIWDSATNGRLLTRVEPTIFIYQEPFEETAQDLGDMFDRHRGMITTNRNLLLEYAKKFEDLGQLDQARQLFLQVYNQWPQWGDSATSLSRLADLHRRQQQWDDAAFLYKLILMENPGTLAEAEAWLGVAQMMEQGHIGELEVDDTLTLNYRYLVNRIRHSVLPDSIRARYSYKQALFESLSSPETALLTLSNLLNEYERGPFVGLYRNFYEQLLFTTIQNKYDAQMDWDLDRIYRQHHHFLAFTTQTRYPSLIAKAYLRLDLPSSAIQVYENMWNYKDSIRGFELAFEEPLTDYLRLLNLMRRDDRLSLRLKDYAALYQRGGRYPDQYLFVDTSHKNRTMSDDDFYAHMKTLPREIGTIYDARRLRLMTLSAQESALLSRKARNDAIDAADKAAEDDAIDQERERWVFADGLYADILKWPRLRNELPVLFQEARLYQADRFYSLGNYFEAERRYQQILGNEAFPSHDRDWAYLQLARLHELKGEEKTSLRIYGQLAYASAPESSMLASYARQRLYAIASSKKLKAIEEEMGLGQF